jgi:hypothetical protein
MTGKGKGKAGRSTFPGKTNTPDWQEKNYLSKKSITDWN